MYLICKGFFFFPLCNAIQYIKPLFRITSPLIFYFSCYNINGDGTTQRRECHGNAHLSTNGIRFFFNPFSARYLKPTSFDDSKYDSQSPTKNFNT